MSQRRRWFASVVFQLVAITGIAACDEAPETVSSYDLPLRLNPLHLQGASDADTVAAWTLFDRDTVTRWSPETGELHVLLDRPWKLSYLKVFGPSTGVLDIRTEDGTMIAQVDLAALRAGWNQVAVPPLDAVDSLKFRALAADSVPDVELWVIDSPRPMLETERLAEQIAYGRLDGQADVLSSQPVSLTLSGGGGDNCGDFVFEVPRDPSVYRRAWFTYGATGLFRPFNITRGLNDGPKKNGQWVSDGNAVGVFAEPIDPERLNPGLNWFQFCLPNGEGGPVVLQEARFVGELDHGTNQVDAVAIGTADAKPTRSAGAILDPLNSEMIEVATTERILLGFERLTTPDAILLATDRSEWQVDCLDAAGAATPLATERTLDGARGVALVVQQGGGEKMCAGLSLQPIKAAARVSFVAIAGSGARHRADWTQIVLASPREHFGRVAWVEGWASPPAGVDILGIEIDGRDAGATGVFGELLRRSGDREVAWPVSIAVELSDGTRTSREFVLGRYADPSGMVETALGGPGTQLTPEESATRYGETGGTVTQAVDPDADTSIRLGTQVGVDVPAGSVSGNGVDITITHLDEASLPKMDPGLINVTAPFHHGYEFLPHGQEFKKPVTVLLPFDPALLPPGYSIDDVNTYFFDEGSQRWRRLVRARVDGDEAGTTRSLTDHFTTMINAIVVAPEHPQASSFNPTEISDIKVADPSSDLKLIEPPAANQKGSASVGYPIDVPMGRGGLQPKLSIKYDSSRGNGWVGVGWDLPLAAISIDTRFGAPRYDAGTETETYTLDGDQLSPMAHRGPIVARTSGTTMIGGEPVKIFHTRVEGGFSKIIRHGDHPNNYWWEVIDKKGTRTFYGGDPDSGGPVAESTLQTADGDIFLWALRETRDTSGNFARYCTERVSDVGLAEGTVTGWELYLKSIDYTRDPDSGRSCDEDDDDQFGPYRVKFLRDSQVGAPRRPDVMIDGKGGLKRVTAQRLRRIEVWFRSTLVRAYDLEYEIGAFHKSLLTSIRQFGVGNSPFPGNVHTFEYYDEVRDNPVGAPAQYDGFAGGQDWSSPDDDIDSGLIVPSAVLGLFGPDEPSALGGGNSHSAGGHIYIGFNPFSPSKTNSFGGKLGFGGSRSTGVAALLDVSGDGLPDKVYRTGSGFQFRPNESGPDGSLAFSGDMFSLPGLGSALSRDTSAFFSAGVEVYPLIFGLIYNHNESFTMTSTYTSDVNGDGLPDLVSGGQVLFNRRTASGGHEFVPTSTGTPFPIVPGSVDTSGLLPDYGDVQDQADAANPLVDTVRFWVAPLSGTVSVNAPVQLVRPSVDGVRVAIQKNGTELWHAEIDGDDLTVKNPTGVSSISVFPGDRIFFRVNSRNKGKDDEVTWSPTITYTGSAVLDENGQNVRVYSSTNDFILGGRPGIHTIAPFEGTVRLQGTLQKTAVTTDGVTVSIRRNGTTVFSSSLAWDAVADIGIDHSFSVDAQDQVELFVGVDSPIDLTTLRFDPVVEMTYTSAFDADGDPVPVNDTSGDPLFKIFVPYDMDIYSVRIPAGLPSPWIAPGDPGDEYTLPIKVTVALPFSPDGLTFTTKQGGSRLAKHTFFWSFGAVQTFTFNLDVDATLSYFFDLSTRDRAVGFGSFISVVIDLGFIEIPLPFAIYTVTDPDLCSRPYRGWSYAGYLPDPDNLDDPIVTTGAHPICSVDSGFDEDTDLPDNRGDLEDNVDTLNDNLVTRAFAPFPGGRTCTIVDGSCQIPAGPLWGGADDLNYINPGRMSSSREGADDFTIPSPGDLAGVGATAVARLGRSSEDGVSVSGGVGPISASFSVTVGTSTGEVDYIDMNGDKFPDVVSHSGVQFTNSRGTLAERLAILSTARESDSVAYNAGIGGNVATSVGNGKGRYGPTGQSPGTTAENGSQMAELGFSLNASGNISTNDVQEELQDINGDGLPDRLSISDGKLWVQLNLGYEFTPDAEEWDDGSTINTGNGSQFGAGGGLGFNDGNYGFGGGFNVATSTGRINEWVDGFQRDGQTLADVNGDGLTDRVVADGDHFAVRFNTGAGFGGGATWTGALSRDISENKSTTAGAGGYFTIGIPLCFLACYLIINPGFDLGETLQRPEAALQDVNGDGYPDHLVSEDDGELTVSLNNHGRTNLLKKVNRPMHAWFELEYERKGNTFEDPYSHWVLSRSTVYDGLAGDGADLRVTSFAYGSSVYDRFEREPYGFAEVVETDHDTTRPGHPAYRKTVQQFNNTSFFLRGQLLRETLFGVDTGVDLVYIDTQNSYILRDVDSGVETSDPQVLRLTLSSVFPALDTVTRRISEGDPMIALETQTSTRYDAFGNATFFSENGDPGPDDDYTATVTYTGTPSGAHASCADNYIVGLSDSIVVRNAAGDVLRSRSATYDCTGGDLLSIEHVTDGGGGTSVSNFAYDPVFGNLIQVIGPENHAGDRYQLDFVYDSEIQTHIQTVTDSFGLTSETIYDLRFGEVSSTTDTNGNTVSRTYDDFSRLITVTAPYEQGTGHATITFEYHPEDAVPWSRTQHLDPFRDVTDPIETILFIDGLKNVVQTKKDITLHTGRTSLPEHVMQISGAITFDHVGRTVDSFYPTTEAKNDTLNTTYFSGHDTEAPPQQKTYDVLDRVTLTVLPDASTLTQEYTLGADRHGVLRAVKTATDPLGRRKVHYSDVTKLQTALQEFNETKGEIIWTEYAYDPLAQLVEIIDDHDNHTTSEYDLIGRRTVFDNPDTGRIETVYDPAGNVVEKTTGHVGAAGASVTYEYDHNRRTAIHYPLFPENDVTYDYGHASLRGHGGNRAGRVIRVTDESGVEERLYGKLGEMVQETKTLASDTLGACAGCPEIWTTRYVYDSFGRLQEMTYPDTEVVSYSYDSGGQVRAVMGLKAGDQFDYVERLEYDKFDKRVFLRYENDVETTWTYDTIDRRLNRREAGTFEDRSYEYDLVGNVTHQLNDVPPGHANEMGGVVETSYEYDALYRLIHSAGTFKYAPHKTDAYDVTLDYDTINSILSKKQEHTVQTKTNNPIPQHKTSYDWEYTYDADQPHAPSRIAGDAHSGFADRAYFYDASGNQLGWDDLTSGRRRTIVWDEENRMQSISDNGRTTTFKYDDAGQRVIKRGAQGETAYINQFWTVRNRTIGTKHVFVGTSRLISKLSPGTAHANPGGLWGDMLHGWAEHYGGVFPGRAVGHHKNRVPDDNFLYFYHADHLASTGWVTDKDGELYEHIEYFPGGETWVAENSNTERMPYLFTSKEMDQETDLYYFGARYYDPKTSVWQSTDPALVDQPSGQTIGKPMVLSAYNYAALNPLGHNDPDGRKEVPKGTKLGPGDWYEKDRKNNTATWRNANAYNLQQSAGNKEYTTIDQRAAFYKWFQGESDKKGNETRWAGAANKVVEAVSWLDTAWYGANVRKFANDGNTAIFDDVFPKLRNLYNGPPVKGNDAFKWDAMATSQEQALIQPHYDKAKAGGYLEPIADAAGQKGIINTIGAPFVTDLPAFTGDIMNVRERWSYGMKAMGYGAPGHPSVNPSDMPHPGSKYAP